MKKHKLSGCGAAMITPFKANMEIDWERLGSMINYVIEGGTDYIVVLGTTAETPTLSKEEKQEVIAFFKRHIAGRVPIVLGCGGNNTLALEKELKDLDPEGIDAILSVTPYYNKPSQEGLYRHKGFARARYPLQCAWPYGCEYVGRHHLPSGKGFRQYHRREGGFGQD